MLIFTAITPHSPLLIPTVGKDNAKKLKATSDALQKLEENFYASMIDDIIIIAPDDSLAEKSFTINFAPTYKGNFNEFGDFSLKPTYHGDDYLTVKIKEKFAPENLIRLITIEELDYKYLVPLNFLCEHKKDLRIVPLSPAQLSFADHFNFGRELAELIINSSKRIAVVTSIETSNQLTKDSPDGYTPKAKKFDKKIIDLIKEKKYQEIAEINPEQADKAGFTEMKALLILLGILSKVNHEVDILSYEGPFGVGNLTVEFRL